MATNQPAVDSVRASRDGHEFHEAWTARKALQLLFPSDGLVAIAVEGLHSSDLSKTPAETSDIADLVLYYGKNASFNNCHRVSFAQFKYSISNANRPFRVSDAKETIRKFSKTYLAYKKDYSEREVHKKLRFEIVTNRPVFDAFEKAIECLSLGKKFPDQAVKQQARQFKKASELSASKLSNFSKLFSVIGVSGNLHAIKLDTSRIMVDWSPGTDSLAKIRLGSLKQTIRDKAGYAGQGNNRHIIKLTDVLGALEISDKEDLFPCKTSFADVGPIVARKQLQDVIKLIPNLSRPLLIHAAGGIGKTVFLESLAKSISANHEIVVFDCFGGGAYRSPEDSRHLPRRGLMHIANILASRGLCDPILPGSDLVPELLKTFRNRLSQAVNTAKRTQKNRQLVIFIDAIDNAAEYAEEQKEDSFPKVLLQSVQSSGPIPGVKLIVTCRSHRIKIAKGEISCQELQLEPFTIEETELFIRDRFKKVTSTEIKVAQSRSGGNARILEHLVKSRGLLDESEINKKITLDDLLRDRIEKALTEASRRGYSEENINTFLSGLAVLPPPVPLSEYASAHNMNISAIESFAADLAPLLEQTKYGLMFRDEPTETLIRAKYGSKTASLKRVAQNLLAHQKSSVYAAKALPFLLRRLNDGKKLFSLAFDENFPATITSTVGKRNIRYARLKAAVSYFASKHDYNRLVHLLVELSTIAATDQRGKNYILCYPDLVILANDIDAIRRLFEIRTSWPGKRHARLVIAHTLSGDNEDASRHAVMADEWIWHYYNNPPERTEEEGGPTPLDIAAVPFWLISQNRIKPAIARLRGWKDWYAYEVCEFLFSLLGTSKSRHIDNFLKGLNREIGIIVSALSFANMNKNRQVELLKKLGAACQKSKKLEFPDSFRKKSDYSLQDGLLKAVAIATSLGLKKEAKNIFKIIPRSTPGLWSFRDHLLDRSIFAFVAENALLSAVNNVVLKKESLLPRELIGICSKISYANESEFKKKMIEAIEQSPAPKKNESTNRFEGLSYDEKQEAKRFINERLDSLFALTKEFETIISCLPNKADKSFPSFLKIWSESGKKRDSYNYNLDYSRFFQILGTQIALFLLWLRPDLKPATVKELLQTIDNQKILSAIQRIQIVKLLSRKADLHTLAGEEAIKSQKLIEKDDDVVSRSAFFAELGQAIAPASKDEAAEYFRTGLEQMDAIGSGDYDFTNELLLFASSLNGKELAGKDFHTLTNICELNMYEAEKFTWPLFGEALSKTSGCRGLAKLSRWDDREKVSIDYSLLPYLTALTNDNKIKADVAVSMLRLSNPVELHSCDTATFSQAITRKKTATTSAALQDLIEQFIENKPGIAVDSIASSLLNLAKTTLGTCDVTSYLESAQKIVGDARKENNENMNYHGKSRYAPSSKQTSGNPDVLKLRKIIRETNPIDENSLREAIDKVNEIKNFYDLYNKFFSEINSKVAFGNRREYIRVVSNLKNLSIYAKLDELKKCKTAWEASSTTIRDAIKKSATPILQIHSEDFISYGRLSNYHLQNLSDITGVKTSELTLELIKIFSATDWAIPASVWLGMASAISDKNDPGEGQKALTRLLNSGAAKLASSVEDGEWKDELYPANNEIKIAAGLIWRMLGSPYASERWRAAHSVRRLAKFNQWDIVDELIAKIDTKNAIPFQAPELMFYFSHARLWLLIALSRIAIDHPKNIAKYAKLLKRVVLESGHVLMRHFSAAALSSCAEKGALFFNQKEMEKIRNINTSPFPRLKKKLRTANSDFYKSERPKGKSEIEPEFHLDYDFEKYRVSDLGEIFGKPHWEIRDLMTLAVRRYDKKIKTMYEPGGRPENRRDAIGMTSKFHTYGQQLGWHTLFEVAADMLAKYPVTDDSYNEEPWQAFLNGSLLTRKDGLWLSDGMDNPPLDIYFNLLEKGKKELEVTGDKKKLLGLISTNTSFTVNGFWHSPDKIQVNISSALVTPKEAEKLTKRLLRDRPFSTWLPSYSYRSEEYSENKKKGYMPWITCPSVEGGLDEHDPLATTYVMQRPRFSSEISKSFSLKSSDPFYRNWENAADIVAYAEAWGTKSRYDDDTSFSGTRLRCSEKFLRQILTQKKADLLVLIKLQRYEKGIGSEGGKFFNTVAVVRITKEMKLMYYPGAINKLLESKY